MAATTLSDLCRDMEQQAGKDDLTGAQALLQQILDQCGSVSRALKQLGRNGPGK